MSGIGQTLKLLRRDSVFVRIYYLLEERYLGMRKLQTDKGEFTDLTKDDEEYLMAG